MDELLITGVGAVRPEGANTASLAPARWAGPPARLARMDRLCALALVAADGAIADAGLVPGQPAWNGGAAAIVLGTAYGCHATNEDYYKSYLQGGLAGASPRLFAYTLPSSPVGEISIHYGMTGPATALAQGGSAGLDAVVDGARQLASGRASLAVCVAADVATPLLRRLLEDEGQADPIEDASAAVLVESAAQVAATGRRGKARIVTSASAFLAGQRTAAIERAMATALVQAKVDEPRVLHTEPSLLAAAPLAALATWLNDSSAHGFAVVAAGDVEGSATALVVEKLEVVA